MSVAPKRRHHPRAVPTAQRISIRERFGFNPSLCCWCGASIEMDYSREAGGSDAAIRRMNDFLDAHEDCKPQEVTEVQS